MSADVLGARVAAVLDEIDQARAALERLKLLEPAFHEGVRPRFEQTLTGQQDILTDLARSLKGGEADAAGWKLLGAARSDLGPVLRDIHATVQSAGARRDGLDRGLLRMADAMLDELGTADEFKARMTVLADREFYPGDQVAEMIRLRFPDTRIWTLPIVAHEFAHFLVRSLRIDKPPGYRYPFIELLDGFAERLVRSRLEELLADIFATYSIGPAYGFTTVRLRFDMSERTEFDTHPSPTVRVEAVIRTLETLTPADRYGHPYAGQINVLRETWYRMRGTHEVAVAENERIDLALLDTHFPAISRILRESVPQVRYRTFGDARIVAPMLRDGAWAARPDLRPSIRDVLNAAWIARLQADDDRATSRVETEASAIIARRIDEGRTSGVGSK